MIMQRSHKITHKIQQFVPLQSVWNYLCQDQRECASKAKESLHAQPCLGCLSHRERDSLSAHRIYELCSADFFYSTKDLARRAHGAAKHRRDVLISHGVTSSPVD